MKLPSQMADKGITNAVVPQAKFTWMCEWVRIKVKGKIVPYSCFSTTHWRRMRGTKGITQLILKLGNRWSQLASFKFQPLYPKWNRPTVPIGHEVGWAPEPIRKLWRRWKYDTSAEKRTMASRSFRSSTKVPLLARCGYGYLCIALWCLPT
jgi:hypothetical protein